MKKKIVKKQTGPVEKPKSKKAPEKKIFAEPKVSKSQKDKTNNTWNPSRIASRVKPR